jgi:hypothetical protein
MENLQVIPNIPNFGTSEELPKEFTVEIPSSAIMRYGQKEMGEFIWDFRQEAMMKGYELTEYYDVLIMSFVIKGKFMGTPKEEESYIYKTIHDNQNTNRS